MKSKTPFLFASGLIMVLSFCLVPRAYSQLESAIEQFTGENTKGYLQPFVNAFSNNLNAGIYRSAHVSRLGLHLYVGIVGMATMISDEDKSFMGMPPLPFPQEKVETATVFGGNGAVVQGPQGLRYYFQNGILQGNVVPFGVPHFEVGSFLGTSVKFRYFSGNIPGDNGKTLGKIQLVGYGIQHSLSQYFILFPIDVSAGLFYQKFDVGDYLSTRALSIGLQASKSIPLLTVYGTLALESTSMDVHYTFKATEKPEKISLELKSEDHFRLTLGVQLRLGLLLLNGDYAIGSQQTASLGLGVGI